MRYTVIWRQLALDTLADLWFSSNRRESITQSVDEIDRLLRHDPEQCGEEYYGDRIVVVNLLEVIFQVQEDDRIVEVITIWHR
jgi:mRNA-degrading endonuclease RelE of RelBE toxin-antitoxin system